jgi:hypothetical protein
MARSPVGQGTGRRKLRDPASEPSMKNVLSNTTNIEEVEHYSPEGIF